MISVYNGFHHTGVPWVPSIPSHWKLIRLKDGLQGLLSGGTPDSGNEAYWSDDENGTPWVAIGDMTKADMVRYTEKSVSPLGLSAKRLPILPVGTLLYSIYASLGKVAVLGVEATTNQAILGVIPNTKMLNERFLMYWLKHWEQYLGLFSSSNTQHNLNAEKVRNFAVTQPPLDEQNRIAAFLDYETAKIDALIEKQQQLIELLGEKRQAVISHAVTKGLNPDAPMRDSGVEWLEQVPAHWDVGPLKRFWSVIDCKHVTVPFYDQGFPVASVMEVRKFELDLSQVLRTDRANFELLRSGGREPKRGDVIYCRNTANTGTSAYIGTDEPICIGQDVVLIKSREQNGRYLNYILHGPEMLTQLSQYMVGSTFKRINVAEIRELIVTCPPHTEQNKLVEYLDKKSIQFDRLMRNANDMVDILQERRTALISAAVTGKIDVRGWKRPTADR